jgi:hypothetical protein
MGGATRNVRVLSTRWACHSVKDARERGFAVARAGWSDSCIFLFFLRIRHLPSPVSRSQTTRTPSFPRRICARVFASLLHPPGIEGWAERRETFGCVRGTRGACHLASKTRVNALMTRHARRLARRLASHDAGRSPLGAPPWRFWAPGAALSVSFGARRPTTAGSCLRIRRASSSQPGRSAWRATFRASRGKRLQAAAAGRHTLAPPSGCLRTTPLKERGWEAM